MAATFFGLLSVAQRPKGISPALLGRQIHRYPLAAVARDRIAVLSSRGKLPPRVAKPPGPGIPSGTVDLQRTWEAAVLAEEVLNVAADRFGHEAAWSVTAS